MGTRGSVSGRPGARGTGGEERREPDRGSPLRDAQVEPVPARGPTREGAAQERHSHSQILKRVSAFPALRSWGPVRPARYGVMVGV